MSKTTNSEPSAAASKGRRGKTLRYRAAISPSGEKTGAVLYTRPSSPASYRVPGSSQRPVSRASRPRRPVASPGIGEGSRAVAVRGNGGSASSSSSGAISSRTNGKVAATSRTCSVKARRVASGSPTTGALCSAATASVRPPCPGLRSEGNGVSSPLGEGVLGVAALRRRPGGHPDPAAGRLGDDRGHRRVPLVAVGALRRAVHPPVPVAGFHGERVGAVAAVPHDLRHHLRGEAAVLLAQQLLHPGLADPGVGEVGGAGPLL